jgi:putative flippase GtrA
MRTLISQFARFGVVGAVGFVVDFGIFNILRATWLSPTQNHEGPIWAKVISTCVAIIVNWMGNRYWTFRNEQRRHPVSEGVEFFVVSLVGLGIGLGCLWVSHYLLGLTSPLADNISANVIGLGLGTLFRFALYRLWVFSPKRKAASNARTTKTTVVEPRESASLGSAETPV